MRRYEILGAGGRARPYDIYSSLDRALLVAIDLVSSGHESALEVTGYVGSALYSLEADTKVDEADPFYPVIVHRR